MAQAGFPWQGQQTAHEAGTLSEKSDLPNGSTNNNTTAGGVLNDTTNHKSISFCQPEVRSKKHGSVKRRSDSVKQGAIARPNVRSQPEPNQPPPKPFNRIPVRTIPAWIQDADEDDVIEASYLLPETPNSALVASHNHTPSSLQRPQPSGGFPLSSGGTRSEPTSRWISFARASAYPRENFKSEKVDADWLNENFTDYSKPWLADHNEDDVEDGSDKYRAFRRKRRVWYKRLHFAVMRNPFVPLVFRLCIIVCAATAMGLGASIFHENNKLQVCLDQDPSGRTDACITRVGTGVLDYDREDSSSLMATIVDIIAIVYSIYITYDEYFSKPLGLRPASAKVRLVLLDLFFIIFQSANLSLAFNTIQSNRGPCNRGLADSHNFRFDNVCDRAQALASILFLSLVAWLLTFSVSILRYVPRYFCKFNI